jgi:hypothetical protein
MKITQASVLLVVATSFLTFSALSFIIAPRAMTLSLHSPTLFVELLAIAGVAFGAMAVRQLLTINKLLPAQAAA